MFRASSPEEFKPVADKIEMKTLVCGNNTLMAEFHLEKGALLPRHSHPHEQTGYLISGKMELTINDESFIVRPGDSWCIAGDSEHHATVLENSTAIEVFSPVREDYLR